MVHFVNHFYFLLLVKMDHLFHHCELYKCKTNVLSAEIRDRYTHATRAGYGKNVIMIYFPILIDIYHNSTTACLMCILTEA